jgi:acetyl-CoA C-acetyltransferase
MSGNQTVIVYAKRTAIGKMSGAFSKVTAPNLAAPLVKDAIEKTGVKPEEVDEIIMGNVLTAGVGQAPARQAAIYGGLPNSVCATTIGRVCGSGLKSMMLADQAIRLGDAQVVFAGGMENMTLAPHLLMGARAGYRFGSAEAKDHMQFDGLWDPYGDMAMGVCGEICAKEYGFTREDQDEFATRSYERSRKNAENGTFAAEIVPVEIKSRRGSIMVDKDEEPFSVDLDKLVKLRPAFDKEGSVTAGNASSINDGAALTVLCSEKTAADKGLTPLAKIIGQASYAQEPKWFTTAPVACIKKVLEKTNLKVEDIDLWEINEAFSVVTMAAIKDLKLDPETVNVFGGAVSMGHPIGASGTRIVVTLINALKAAGKKRGCAAICIGGGEASAIVVELA